MFFFQSFVFRAPLRSWVLFSFRLRFRSVPSRFIFSSCRCLRLFFLKPVRAAAFVRWRRALRFLIGVRAAALSDPAGRRKRADRLRVSLRRQRHSLSRRASSIQALKAIPAWSLGETMGPRVPALFPNACSRGQLIARSGSSTRTVNSSWGA